MDVDAQHSSDLIGSSSLDFKSLKSASSPSFDELGWQPSMSSMRNRSRSSLKQMSSDSMHGDGGGGGGGGGVCVGGVRDLKSLSSVGTDITRADTVTMRQDSSTTHFSKLGQHPSKSKNSFKQLSADMEAGDGVTMLSTICMCIRQLTLKCLKKNRLWYCYAFSHGVEIPPPPPPALSLSSFCPQRFIAAMLFRRRRRKRRRITTYSVSVDATR